MIRLCRSDPEKDSTYLPLLCSVTSESSFQTVIHSQLMRPTARPGIAREAKEQWHSQTLIALLFSPSAVYRITIKDRDLSSTSEVHAVLVAAERVKFVPVNFLLEFDILQHTLGHNHHGLKISKSHLRLSDLETYGNDRHRSSTLFTFQIPRGTDNNVVSGGTDSISPVIDLADLPKAIKIDRFLIDMTTLNKLCETPDG